MNSAIKPEVKASYLDELLRIIHGNFVSVEIGKIKDSPNPSLVLSKYFAYCSAVVLDYGSGNLFAHVLPSSSPEYLGPCTTLGNVVGRFVKIMNRKDIPLESTKAYVNAGSQEALNQITNELTDSGIEIVVANTKLSPPSMPKDAHFRDVTYDSISHKLDIKLS